MTTEVDSYAVLSQLGTCMANTLRCLQLWKGVKGQMAGFPSCLRKFLLVCMYSSRALFTNEDGKMVVAMFASTRQVGIPSLSNP